MKYLAIITLFILGLIFCLSYKSSDFREGFESSNCPNLLIQKGSEIHLVNTNKAEVPGVNPITFKNLEEYIEYMQWMKANNIDCPVLFLQQTFTTQGERGYRMLSDPLDPQEGIPSNMDGSFAVIPLTKLTDANRDDPPYNANNFSGFDPQNQYSGLYTPLDQVECTKEDGVDNPMCNKWNPKTAASHLSQGKYLKRTRPDANGNLNKSLFDINLGINSKTSNSIVGERNNLLSTPYSRTNPISDISRDDLREKTQPNSMRNENLSPEKLEELTPEQRALNAN